MPADVSGRHKGPPLERDNLDVLCNVPNLLDVNDKVVGPDPCGEDHAMLPAMSLAACHGNDEGTCANISGADPYFMTTYDKLSNEALQAILQDEGISDRDVLMQFAIAAYHCIPFLSMNSAAKCFGIPPSTFKSRLSDTQSRREVRKHQMHLGFTQEDILAVVIKEKGCRGIPLTPTLMTAYAEAISGHVISTSWYCKFLDRHPDIKTKMSTTLKKCCADALNRTVVGEFYNLLEELVNEYNIPPKNIYNVDEKGVQLGIAPHEIVLVDRAQRDAYSIASNDRELITVIECISTNGVALNPSVIFKGARPKSEWGQDNPGNASILTSPNGWTDQELLWLKKDFNCLSSARNCTGRHHLLILDGHPSHCTYKFVNFADKNKIIIICLPSHTSHVLQPCDVCAFGPLSWRWKTYVAKVGQRYVSISKNNFLQHYATVRKAALKPHTISAAFRMTSIFPFNCHALSDDKFAPAKNTMINPRTAPLFPNNPPSTLIPSGVISGESSVLPLTCEHVAMLAVSEHASTASVTLTASTITPAPSTATPTLEGAEHLNSCNASTATSKSPSSVSTLSTTR